MFPKVVGTFFSIVIAIKFILTENLQPGEVLFLAVLFGLMLSLILLSWEIELSFGKITSKIGIPYFKRTKVYNNVRCINLGIDSQNVDGGGSNIVITLTAEMSDGVGRVSLKGNYAEKNEENIDLYSSKIAAVLGVPIEATPRFNLVYEERYGRPPRLEP